MISFNSYSLHKPYATCMLDWNGMSLNTFHYSPVLSILDSNNLSSALFMTLGSRLAEEMLNSGESNWPLTPIYVAILWQKSSITIQPQLYRDTFAEVSGSELAGTPTINALRRIPHKKDIYIWNVLNVPGEMRASDRWDLTFLASPLFR